jgi:hypothetical protein
MIRTKKFENLPQITSISPSGKIVVTENGVDKVISFEDFSNLPATNDIWNNASTTFTAYEVNVTDIQSAADSKLLDLKVNTTSKFVVRKDGNLGIGVTNPAARLDISDTVLAGSGSLAGSALNLAQTWNTTGAPTAIKLNVTNTASGAASNLLDLQVDTVSKFAITKGGQIIGSAGSALLPTYGFFDSNWGTGYAGWFKTADMIACSAAGGTATPFSISHIGLKIQNSIPIGWTSSTGVGTLDTILIRDGAANTLAQRNGVNPQTFRLYNTYTDANTFERLNIKWDTNVLKIGTEKGSVGGTARNLELQTDATTRMTVTSAGNVGIGTTTPLNTLHIYSASSEFARIERNSPSGTGSMGIYQSGSNRLLLGYNSDVGNGQANGGIASAGVVRGDAGLHLVSGSSAVGGITVITSGNVGIGIITPAARLDISDTTLAGSGSLAGSILNLAQTWNTTGAPTAIKLNVTNTASGAASNLLDLQVDTVSKFKVNKLGDLTLAGSTGVTLIGGGGFRATSYIDVNIIGLITSSSGGIGFSSGGTGATYDTALFRDAAGTLAQRNGVNPQAFRLYNTYTDATTFERLNIKWDTNVLKLGTEKGSAGGTARDLVLETNATERVRVLSTGNVGIGTTTPDYKLSVSDTSGGLPFSSSGTFSSRFYHGGYALTYEVGLDASNNAGIRLITTSSNSSPSIQFNNSNAYSHIYLSTTSYGNGNLNFLVQGYGTLILRKGDNRQGNAILSSLAGDTTYNNASLLVRNRWDGAPGAVIAKLATTTTADIFQVTNESLSPYFNVNATGNVGVGITTPLAKLDIAETWNSNIAVTGASGTGSVATITFATQSAVIPVGSTIVVASVNPAGYNGTFVVTASSVTSVSYANATTTTYVSSGTVQQLFTAIKLNVTNTASAAASNLLDLQVGGNSKLKVDKNGVIFLPENGGDSSALCLGGTAVTNCTAYLSIYGLRLSSDLPMSWSSGRNLNVLDTHINRGGAANIHLGAPDAAAPVAQTLSVQSVIAGTTNTAGANFTIDGSQGTGTGIGGSILFRTAPAGSSGTAVNALATALTINSTGKATFAPTINSTNSFEITNLAGSPIVTIDSTNRRFNAGGGALSVSTSTGATTLYDAAYLGWQDVNTADGGSTDLRLYRDASNSLALRNGVSPQTFRLYNTYTDASNYERGFIAWTSNVLSIGTEQAGTGIARNMQIVSGGRLILRAGLDQPLRLGAGGNDRWDISSSGHFIALTDNAYDIGASGATRPRNIYAGNRLYAGSGGIEVSSTSYIYWANRSLISSPLDSILLLQNQAATDFNRIQLGGTTSSFPAIKRNGAAIQIRLADDSANAALETAGLTVVGSASVSGHFSATTKSFLIPHPTKPDKKLQYACLEGPENGVYIRGKTNEPIILLPDYWSELVDADSITVTVTPIGKPQQLFVVSQNSTSVEIGNVDGLYNYLIFAERKDVNKLQTEI